MLGKLEQAFSIGCTDSEACLYAGINPDTLYEYCKKNPDFTERKEALKESPVLLARQTVVGDLKKNPDLAFRYLERKRRKEFGPRQELEHSGKVDVNHSAKGELLEKLKNALSGDNQQTAAEGKLACEPAKPTPEG